MSKQYVFLLAVGSFNPPTIMHLRIMELARDVLHRIGAYKVVGGALSPVHDGYGKKDLASSSHRLEMTRLALGTSNWVRTSPWEANNKEWTRTRLVVDYHQSRINQYLNGDLKATERDSWMPDFKALDPDIGAVTCRLVCGADVLESINIPNLWCDEDIRTLSEDYGFVVISREGNDPYKSIYTSDILHANRSNIIVVHEWLSNEISSTRIRRALRRNESVKYIVPDSVIEYISSNELYGYTRKY